MDAKTIDGDLVTTPPVLHTFDEAAAIAGISKRYLQLRIANGTGPDVTRIGRRAFVRDDRLAAWLDQLTVGPEAQVEYDELEHAALTVLAAVKANVIDGDPKAMLATLRGSAREVSLRLAEATNIIANLCKMSDQPEAMLAGLVENVIRRD
jgi:hypothetical protein